MWHAVWCTGICYHHLQGSSTLQMEAAGFIKILVPIYHLHDIISQKIIILIFPAVRTWNLMIVLITLSRIECRRINCLLCTWTHSEKLSPYNVQWRSPLACSERCELHAHITSISHQNTDKGICKNIMHHRINQLMMSIYSLSHKDGVMSLAHWFLSPTHHYVRITIHDCLSA